MAQRTKEQHNVRRHATFKDQHGRTWEGTTEHVTGHVTGPLNPMFEAPVLPTHQKYIRHDPLDTHRVHIDYDRWLADSKESHAAWERSLQEWAVKLGVQGTITELIKDPPAELLLLVGPRPDRVHPTVIQAAQAGNRWVVFGEGEMPEAARPYFPEPEKREAPQAGPVRDPFAPAVTEKDTADPFAGDEFPKWQFPKGWELSNGEIVERKDDESKEDFKARAQELQAQLLVEA